MRGGALFNGKEGRGDFRKEFIKGKGGLVGFRKKHHYGKRMTGVVSDSSLQRAVAA